MRILITGATGFVGKNLLQALSKGSDMLAVAVRYAKNQLSDQDSAQVICTSDKEWKQQVKDFNPEVVIHLAAYLSSQDNEEAITQLIEANILFGTNLLDALRGTNIKYFVNTGTFAEYADNGAIPNPAYLYAATKTAFRSILNYYQLLQQFKVINVIPYTIYGGLDSQKKLVDYIYSSLDGATPVKMSPGEQQLDLIHIDDVISFYLTLLHSLNEIKEPYTEFHLGNGMGFTPKSIAASMEMITGKTAMIEWGGIPYRDRDTLYAIANKHLPEAKIGWKPSITLEAGLKKYIKLLKNKEENGI